MHLLRLEICGAAASGCDRIAFNSAGPFLGVTERNYGNPVIAIL